IGARPYSRPRSPTRSIVAAALRKCNGGSFSNRPAGRKANWLRIPREFMPAWILRRVIDVGARWRKSPDGQGVQNRKRSIRRLRRWLRAHGAGAYFGSIFLLTAAMVVAPLLFSAGSVHSLTHGLLGFLLLLPASELAVLAVNYFVTSLLPPQVLPKMSFKKEGIPDDCRTLVVVPLLLTTPDAIQNELNRLEIRYLGNTNANLRFSLLTDFADAPRQNMP